MGKCIVCGEELSFWQGDEHRRCKKCIQADRWPEGHHVPMEKERQKNLASAPNDSVEHGVFTDIAYITAWAAAILGTLIGVLMIVSGLEAYGEPQTAVLGGVIIISSWIGASGVGTLSEISRKLSYSEMAAKKTLSQEDRGS